MLPAKVRALSSVVSGTDWATATANNSPIGLGLPFVIAVGALPPAFCAGVTSFFVRTGFAVLAWVPFLGYFGSDRGNDVGDGSFSIGAKRTARFAVDPVSDCCLPFMIRAFLAFPGSPETAAGGNISRPFVSIFLLIPLRGQKRMGHLQTVVLRTSLI